LTNDAHFRDLVTKAYVSLSDSGTKRAVRAVLVQ